MCCILVLGAAGYIGLSASIALRQSGHRVYGVVRTEAATKILIAHEIIPIIGDISHPSSILSQSFFPLLTHIVDSATASYPVLNEWLDGVTEAAIKTPHRKLSYIYTSGVLVYGKQENGVVLSETHPIVPFAPYAASQTARKSFEDRILSSAALRGTVVRPGWVYGGNGGHYLDDLWAYDSATGNYTITGSPSKRWSWIHISDLSSAYVHLVNSPSSLICSEIFNIADSTRADWSTIKAAAVRAAMTIESECAGKGKVEVGKEIVKVKAAGSDGFSQAAELSIVISAEKLQRFCGWTAKFNFLEGTEIYYQAWKVAFERRKALAAVAARAATTAGTAGTVAPASSSASSSEAASAH